MFVLCTESTAHRQKRKPRLLLRAGGSGRLPVLYLRVAGRGYMGGGAGAVQDAGGGADVHVQGDAVAGMAGHPGHVGGLELPGKQGGRAEHMPQAVPGPPALPAASRHPAAR
jgi:hypothetical protein